MVTPAVVVSKTCSYRPSPYLETSVLVPPCPPLVEHRFRPTISTYHIKPNHGGLGLVVVRGDGVSNNTSSWTRENGLQPSELVDIHQPAVTLHKLASCPLGAFLLLDAASSKATFKPGLEAINVLANGWREIGIGADRCGSRNK